MNKTTILRSPKDKDHPFTRISNILIADSRLSDTEVGVMVRILANSDDWIINKDYQKRKSLLTRGSFNTAWRNLITCGYIEQIKIFSPQISFTYKIFENPVLDTRYPTHQSPLVEIPLVENGALITTNIKNDPEKNLTGGVEHHRNAVEVRHPTRTKPEKLDQDKTGPDTGPLEIKNYDSMLDQLWKQVIEKGI